MTDTPSRAPNRVAPLSPIERLQRECIELRERNAAQAETIKALQRVADASIIAEDRAATSQARSLELACYRTSLQTFTSLVQRLTRTQELLARAHSGARRLRKALEVQAAKPKPQPAPPPTLTSELFELCEEVASSAGHLRALVMHRRSAVASSDAVRNLLDAQLPALLGADKTGAQHVARVLLTVCETVAPAPIGEQSAKQRFRAGNLSLEDYQRMVDGEKKGREAFEKTKRDLLSHVADADGNLQARLKDGTIDFAIGGTPRFLIQPTELQVFPGTETAQLLVSREGYYDRAVGLMKALSDDPRVRRWIGQVDECGIVVTQGSLEKVAVVSIRYKVTGSCISTVPVRSIMGKGL